MAILKSYDLKGNKLSFANWISNLSPCDTPFISMIGKEKVDQTQYSWQVDTLSAPINTGFQEGSDFVFAARTGTQVFDNYTQILRKVVKVSDTTKKVGLYGRASELAYQLEKAGKEIKRDLELMVLTNEAGNIGTSAKASKMSGFIPLCAALGTADGDTGATTHKEYEYAKDAEKKFTQASLFDMTYQLYIAGSKANKIMVHPGHMHVFADMIGFSDKVNTHRMFDGMDTKFNLHVGKVRDPLGQEFTIIPNRWMPLDKIFIFNEKDWTQMVLREPVKTELAKNGSAEKHMIEMEVGLRHKNPHASGIMVLKEAAAGGGGLKAKAVKAKAE